MTFQSQTSLDPENTVESDQDVPASFCIRVILDVKIGAQYSGVNVS